MSSTSQEITDRKWWKEGIVYQIYPRSFQDTSGNGIGDLRGIIQRLDYIASLGVDIIWLNPVYASPNDDNGYDISDYRSIMDEFGTMEDFNVMLKGMHDRGLKLVMDLVVNHSSDEHHWFKEARKSRENPYHHYYHWWPAEKGTPPKRWSYFDVEHDAWNYEKNTNAYYLHYFSEKQPDLNWENPKLRQEVYDMMRFWFEKGVDGFRMDVISFLSKDPSFPGLPEDSVPDDFISVYANGPRLHEYLNEMNREVLSDFDVMTVGEAPGVTIDQALDFVDDDRKELNMFFHFDLMALDRFPGEVFKMNPDGWELSAFKKIFSDWDAAFSKKGWGSIYLSNHDFPRSVSRWGNDSDAHWKNAATMLHTFLLTMRGTPYFYYGDEIGMTNIRFDTIEEYRDINTINKYKQIKAANGDLQAFLDDQKDASRDNARTPMQWDTSVNAGFTTGTSWISINNNYKDRISVAVQEIEEHSVLNYFRKMIKVRKSNLTLIYGTYQLLNVSNENIYAYTRSLDKERFLILLSFSTSTEHFSLPKEINYNYAKKIISNDLIADDKTYKEFMLKPYQAIVYQLL
ncbi:alpha-glucosidase [Sungkyunkwania multivorans]|uniref:Alpha-glucosidase n=1 Tax=Sungkyunkwania multivorans TaxID=1173618 RepID=A0ABW3CSW7_9FLAO